MTGKAVPPSIWMIVALPAEARPIIDHFGLDEDAGSDPYRIYSGVGMSLLISGIGAQKSAAAVAYAAARREGGASLGWINIGVAGHCEYARGTAVLANRILERRTGQTWYPQLVFESPVLTGSVTTVDEPESNYPGIAVYEMEAAGFFGEAVRHSTTELVHVLKIVSDNLHEPLGRVTHKLVESLIRSRLGDIDAVTNIVRSLVEDFASRCGNLGPQLSRCREKWHFTTTQDRQLKKLLQRLDTVGYQDPVLLEGLGHLRTADEVLAALRGQLEASPAVITGP